jgi:hypothetical protein
MNSNQSVSLQLRDYCVRLDNGRTINEPIENIQELTEIIRIYGRRIIAKITFYFHNSDHQFHSLTLRNSEHQNKFVVEFYNYYSPNFNRIELSEEQKMSDLTVVMNYISQNTHLHTHLRQHIINPFHTHVFT